MLWPHNPGAGSHEMESLFTPDMPFWLLLSGPGYRNSLFQFPLTQGIRFA